MQQTTFCALAIWLVLSAAPALATRCEDPRGFQAWVESFRQEAMAQGISQGTIDSALSGINYDPNIISRDHRQGIFQQSFEQFASRMCLDTSFEKGSRHAEAIWVDPRSDRAAIRRSSIRDRCYLGVRDGFWHQLGEVSDISLARKPRLRLPAIRHVSSRAPGRATHR